MQTYYTKRLFYLLLFVSLGKLLVASLLELGNDEVYYYTYALQPSWNHFDHPPLVGILIRFTTFNLHWLNDLSMRLGAIICATISSIFIFFIGKIIANERVGWYAALIYNCSVYTGIIAGLFILPDSPQMLFWTGSLYIMSLLIFKNADKQFKLWLLLGLFIGLAAMSKVHGLYLWFGFGLFIIIKKPNWLLNWRLYTAGAITAICILPILYWNIQNDFITYKFHSERVSHHHIQIDSFIRELLGEFAYQNPIIFVLIVLSFIYFLRQKKAFSAISHIWLLCMSLPMLGLFWGVALFNPTLPHWSGPAYIPLFFLAANYLEIKSIKLYPSFTKVAARLVIILLVFVLVLVHFAPMNFGSQHKENFGEYCPTLDLSGWSQFSDSFAVLHQKDLAKGMMKERATIIINKWFPGGHLQFYTARKAGIAIMGVGSLEDLHKFAWLNKDNRPIELGDDAYSIVPSNMPINPIELYKDYFTEIQSPVIINQVRGNKVVRFFYVYRLKNCKKVPASILP